MDEMQIISDEQIVNMVELFEGLKFPASAVQARRFLNKAGFKTSEKKWNVIELSPDAGVFVSMNEGELYTIYVDATRYESVRSPHTQDLLNEAFAHVASLLIGILGKSDERSNDVPPLITWNLRSGAGVRLTLASSVRIHLLSPRRNALARMDSPVTDEAWTKSIRKAQRSITRKTLGLSSRGI